ncbi:hypothetical protein ACJMK2_036051 [Sinanodonta woodiana]|uniref:Saccharopine dehydrogenase NADP binding domain-containing protein n=1 Tax=Sinanodonta woodiana TaxID=1069815 RepID=A0ABD3WH38_SINWO
MSEERVDFVVFGASGFTGQFVVEELARIADEDNTLSWAVAGRSMEKLQNVLKNASSRTGKNLESIPIFIADVSSESSIVDMCRQAKVVLNCVGPYRFYGEQLVKACIENGAHHLDISGEPQFLERMQLLYHGDAKKSNVYVVGACGFDSVPSDMGVNFMKKQFDGELNAVEFYVNIMNGSTGTAVNTGTLESAVYGFHHSSELKPIRRSLFPKPLPRSPHTMKKRPLVFYSNDVNKWCLPFPGSDKSIIQRSVCYNYENKKQRPIQVNGYFCRPGLFETILVIIFGVIFGIMAKFSFTRSLLLKFPSLFSAGTFKKGGPSIKQIEESSFTINLFGEGYSKKLEDPDEPHEEAPDKRIVVKVSGPDAGYIATPICMVQCALTLLREKDKLPSGGGVYTTCAAFQDTSLTERLTKHNVKFELVKIEDIK